MKGAFYRAASPPAGLREIPAPAWAFGLAHRAKPGDEIARFRLGPMPAGRLSGTVPSPSERTNGRPDERAIE